RELKPTTGPGTTVTGGLYGILTRDYGSGALTVAADGDVTGGTIGINANNYGGALSVTANGDVAGTGNTGISAENFVGSTDLSVTTGPGSTVTGGGQAILPGTPAPA